MTRSKVGSAAVGAATLALLLAACGGATTGGGNPGGSTPPAGGGGQTLAGGGGQTLATAGGSAGAIDVCAAVTAADVGVYMTKPMTAAVPPVQQPAGFSVCHYTASDATAPAVRINAIATGDPSAAALVYGSYQPPQGQPAAIPLSGIGDKAMHVPGTLDLWAVKGSVICSIGIQDPSSAIVADYRGLATPGPNAQDNYPDDSMTAYDQQIGVLCNKVFAAGGA